jgi:hypothetical protein
MFRYFLSLTFAVGVVSAATINTTATCDGVTTVGTDSASCDDGHFEARAGVSSTSAGASAMFLPSSPPDFRGGGAQASFSDDYVFTVTGGTGAGFFVPCLSGSTDAEASAGASFGSIALGLFAFQRNSTCNGPPFFFGQLPFSFGVQQIVHFTISASAGPSPLRGSAFGMASFDGILFFDTSGHPLSNITFTLVEVPEPSAWSLLAVGAMFFLVVAMIRKIRWP